MADTPEEAAIRASISGPKSVTVDGETVDARLTRDQIEADQYLDKKARALAAGIGIKMFKISPPGAR